MTYSSATGTRPTDANAYVTPARRRRLLAVHALVAVSVLLAGCGESGGSNASPAAEHAVAHPSTTASSTSSKPAQFLTVQQLAAAIGCEATMAGKSADFRQASCMVDGAQFVFLDFDTAEGQRAWLDHAKMYGGVYLVGDRWAMSGKSKEYLETLRATLGGTIEERGAHGS